MPSEPKAAILIALILLVLLLGLTTIALLMGAWRRQIDRKQGFPDLEDEEPVDAWAEAGRRAVSDDLDLELDLEEPDSEANPKDDPL